MSTDPPGSAPVLGGLAVPADAGPVTPRHADAESAVTWLYREHALSLTRLAHVMLGDRHAAEDVVQEAFSGLYRNWAKLADQGRAPGYLRASVLNGCRTALRRGRRCEVGGQVPEPAPADSAEVYALAGEEQRAVMQAIRRLPARQREVLILRFFLDESEAGTARAMGITQSTVRSATHRGLAALGRQLRRTP
jgi:RNA polymerase sigma-70 factor (sigma-E family)